MARIEIDWKGEKYVIREDQAFAAAEALEEHFTISDLAKVQTEFNVTKMSTAFAALITFAGGQATKEEIRQAVLGSVASGTQMEIAFVPILEAFMVVLFSGAPAEGDKPAGKPPKAKPKPKKKAKAS